MNGLWLTTTLVLTLACSVSFSSDGSEMIKCVKCNPCEGKPPKAVKCSPEELLPFFHYRSCIKIVNNDTTTNPHGVVKIERRCSTKLPSTEFSCIDNPFHDTPGVMQCKYYCGHDGCNAASSVRAMYLAVILLLVGSLICDMAFTEVS